MSTLQAKQLALLGKGAKILTVAETSGIDLGPLKDLEGTWVSKEGDGWNVIAVPGPAEQGGFTLEVIPYVERLTFTPVVVAGNRGPIIDGVQEEQHLVGFLYEQIITSTCDTALCNKMGFGRGNEIHAETGIFLNVTDFNTVAPSGPSDVVLNLDIARLATIPHGNSVLALGQSATGKPANNDFFPKALIAPTPLNPKEHLPFDYGEGQYKPLQFPQFNQADPNTILRTTLGNDQVASMTTLELSTKLGTGGILNIPFIQQHVNATDMQATFWIERLQNPVASGADILQLQYSQTINLVFPSTGKTQQIIWPHVTVNTLRKV